MMILFTILMLKIKKKRQVQNLQEILSNRSKNEKSS